MAASQLVLGTRPICRRFTFILTSKARAASSVPEWATIDPDAMSGANPAVGMNLCNGEWTSAAKMKAIPDPMNGEAFIKVPDVSLTEIGPYVERMLSVPRSGLHNPIKSPERYNMLGDVCTAAAREMSKPEVQHFYARLIQRLTPKSWRQAMGEPTIVRKWLEDFSCDNVRFLAKSFGVPGDHPGQSSVGYRFPYGGVSVITPFNFPLEICGIQTLSALLMGNMCTTKVDEKVQICMEQFLRMLHHLGLPKEDVNLIYCSGPVMNEILVRGDCRMTLFTGSQVIAEKLCQDLKGRVKLEDAGFDWKVLGPDPSEVEFVAWQADQDAYAFSGQKCSAQSMLFVHENWNTPEIDIVGKLAAKASTRNLKDFTIGPVITWTTERFMNHVKSCLSLPGASLAFGGKPLDPASHSIPARYGAVQPTAVRLPVETLMDPKNFEIATVELFGPFQVIVDYKHEQLPMVLKALNTMQNHLTAGIVSNDMQFLNHVLGNTISGTTYAGIRARTTAAPQQMWFGPSGDPRAGGIHTPEAIKLVWSSHREVVYDFGPVSKDWQPVQA
mmetsp:Transcript_85435/g.160903  ORF Transcript_85435/g.160903 Transcript_85435/m.160903 type:complete len:556 (+) Transcript_85435:34-1701(+)